jgi:hypothetical protein
MNLLKMLSLILLMLLYEATQKKLFQNVSHDELIGFMWKNYARTHELFNFKYHELNGIKTYFQSIRGLQK